MIFVGSKNDDIATTIIETLSERPENQLNMTIARFFGVGLALLFLGRAEACEATLELLSALVTHPISKIYTKKVFFKNSLILFDIFNEKLNYFPSNQLKKHLFTYSLEQYIEVLTEACAYVGSGNVLKVQKMLHHCLDHLEEKDSAH